MSLLDNDNHLPDAEQMALEQSEKFLNNALEIINERSPDDAANCKVVLASLTISQSVLYVGQQYISALVSAVKDISESIDCSGAGSGVADSGTVISLSEKECILSALKARWLKLNPEHTDAQYLAAIRRFELIAGL